MPPLVLDSLFDHLQREFDSGCTKAASDARSEVLGSLNQHLRRLRGYQSESDWVQATLDAGSAYSGQIALFSIANDTARLRGQIPSGVLPDELSFPLSAASAFASAVEMKDPVTALRTAGEVSAELSDGRTSERAHVFPITNGERVSAVLFASDVGSDVHALELVSGLASCVLERKSNQMLHAQIATIVEAPKAAPASGFAPASRAQLPAWSDLPNEQRQLHIRAQRFARVVVAEIQMSRPEACRAGRQQGDLYLFLKREIDKARENYRKQFMTVPSMVDYLHLELIQTAAEGDEQKLGVDYPGRLL